MNPPNIKPMFTIITLPVMGFQRVFFGGGQATPLARFGNSYLSAMYSVPYCAVSVAFFGMALSVYGSIPSASFSTSLRVKILKKSSSLSFYSLWSAFARLASAGQPISSSGVSVELTSRLHCIATRASLRLRHWLSPKMKTPDRLPDVSPTGCRGSSPIKGMMALFGRFPVGDGTIISRESVVNQRGSTRLLALTT